MLKSFRLVSTCQWLLENLTWGSGLVKGLLVLLSIFSWTTSSEGRTQLPQGRGGIWVALIPVNNV